jgi:phage terminase Nu1 subunit (DNA packaging protein)
MSTTESVQPPGRLLTKPELAGYLRVSTRTVNNYLRRGMPYLPCGGRKRFELAPVHDWLALDEQARLRAERARLDES